jgi:hypothetical protein
MRLIQELLALRESNLLIHEFKDLDLWQDGTFGMDSADVDAHYEYEGRSHSDHPYGEGSAREYHGATCSVELVLLQKDTKVYDDEGDEVVDTLKAGTDLMKQPWWKHEWTRWLEDKICESAED